MKVYIITFNDLEIAVDRAYISQELAEKAMKKLVESTDAQAAEAHIKSYSHFYGVDELELIMQEDEL